MTTATVRRHGMRARRLALVFAALVVAACGSSAATPSPTATPAVTPIAIASATPAPTPAPTATPTPTPVPTATPISTGPVSISLQQVVGGLASPIDVESAPGDPRLFVVGQRGVISVVYGGRVVGTFLDVSSRISCCGERGLLGLAFHPKYVSNGKFYVRYTDKSGNLRVSEFKVSADPGKADASSERILITIAHPKFANHNGGRIAFGPDGYLYIGTGDGGSGGDPSNNGQNLGTLLGKLLRIDVDSAADGKPYAIPASNPFVGQAGKRAEIFAFGLRNPYRFGFDRQTGDLWIADVGQNLWEEVDRAFASAGGGSGADFGWSVMEGNHCYKPSSGCKTAGLTLPLLEYAHGTGDAIGCSIIGGFVYRGSAYPSLVGRYFFGDYCTGRIWDVAADAKPGASPQELLKSGLRIVGWGEGSDGEMYLVALGGGLYRLTA
jgi:glucose/arabinose dehydrogenase